MPLLSKFMNGFGTRRPHEADVAGKKVKMDLRHAVNRLNTFHKHKWPKTSPIDIKTLAEAGFYMKPAKTREYTDQVDCAFCKIKIHDWKTGDDPFKEHYRINPRCDFMMGYVVNNIPLDGNLSSDPIRGNNRRLEREPDVCGHSMMRPSNQTIHGIFIPFLGVESMQSSSQESSSPSLSSSQASDSSSSSSSSPSSSPPSSQSSFLNRSFGQDVLQPHRPPTFPTRVTFQSRLSTFPSNWSQLCPVAAASLAEAGLFHVGPIKDGDALIQDTVTCFHCNRNIYKWEENDNPWDEHMRLSPDCYFLKLNNGRRDQGGEQQLTSIGKQLGSIAEKVHEKAHDSQCKVCYSHEIQMVFLPCRHANSCVSCAASVTKCPTCRTRIENSLRIYLS